MVTKTNQEKSLIQRQIESTDKQIDQLVYELYGLTDEEIRKRLPRQLSTASVLQ